MNDQKGEQPLPDVTSGEANETRRLIRASDLPGSSRRSFLRNAGVVGAAGAVGLAALLNASPAQARDRYDRDRDDDHDRDDWDRDDRDLVATITMPKSAIRRF